MTRKTLHIKNMVCQCCIRVIAEDLMKEGITPVRMQLGEIEVEYNEQVTDERKIQSLIRNSGFEIITDRNSIICEQIKRALIELVHYSNNVNSIIRKSDYLVEKMGMSYQQISKTFSKHENITLEKYIIMHKIERTKELIMSNEYTLSEIAFMMDFSSVHHLSNTFRKNTGISVSEFKKNPARYKKSIDQLT
jgi:AraC-like DNA-binding protein